MIPPTSLIPIHDDNPTRTFPYVTVGIIALNVLVFLTEPHFGRGGSLQVAEYFYRWGLVPWEITHGRQLDLTGCLQACFTDKNVYLALLTSMFVHAGPLHLAGNMLFLWIFGNNIEERLGPVGYAVFYLVAGVVAAFAHIATQTNSTVPVVGASGAIAGVMGAYLVLYPKARVLTIIPLFIFLQFVYLPAYVVLLGWLVLQFFTNPNTGVAVAAHIGGFIFGAAVGLVLRGTAHPAPPGPPPPDWGFGGPRY